MMKKLIFFIIFLFVILFWLIFISYRETKRFLVSDLYQLTNRQIDDRKDGYVRLIREYVSQGIECKNYPTNKEVENCLKSLRSKIFQAVGTTEQIRVEYPDLKCGHPESTLFVKRAGDKLQILKLSGEVIEMSLDSKGAQKVAAFIEKPYMQILDRLLDVNNDTIYLGVFYSESELIVPINYNGENIGAVIKHCAT